MDVSQLIQQKLGELGLDQRDLADAAEVTESYISQLLSRKKMPATSERTDIYDKLGRALKLPAGKLAGLADLHSGAKNSFIWICLATESRVIPNWKSRYLLMSCAMHTDEKEAKHNTDMRNLRELTMFSPWRRFDLACRSPDASRTAHVILHGVPIRQLRLSMSLLNQYR